MALSANKPRSYTTYGTMKDNSIGLYASATVYNGSALGLYGGYVRPFTQGDEFLGFSYAHHPMALNQEGPGTSSGDIQVRFYSEGIVQLDVTGVTSGADVGKAVFVYDDDTFTLLSSGGANSRIGHVWAWISSTTCWVKFCQCKSDKLKITQRGLYSSTTAGYGVPVGTTNTAADRLYADDGGVALTSSSNLRARENRFLVTTAATITSAGIVSTNNHLKTTATITSASSGFVAGSMGYLELAGTATSGDAHAGVVAVADAPTGTTIGSSCVLAGLQVTSFDARGTHTGVMAVIDVRNPMAGGNWDAFLNLPASGTFIASSGAGGGTSKYLKCLIGGVAYSILIKSDA